MEQDRIFFWRNKPTWMIYDLVFLLREVEPAPFAEQDERIRPQLKTDLENWTAWAPGCPLLHPAELCKMTTPVNASKLLAWAQSLAGVEIPECWMPLINTVEPPRPDDLADPFAALFAANAPATKPLGDRAAENLLMTIGALALLFADKSPPKYGSAKDPVVAEIAKACREYAGDATHMALSTVRDRITQGIKILNERK